jgi:hypothetical protein
MQAGITEMAYHALRRNVSFMRPRRKGQEELPQEHLLALKAFSLLRAHGLRPAIAAAAIEAAYPAILTYTRESRVPSPENYKVGVRLVTVRGKIVAAALDALPQAGVEEVGRVELDLRGIATLLPSHKQS